MLIVESRLIDEQNSLLMPVKLTNLSQKAVLRGWESATVLVECGIWVEYQIHVNSKSSHIYTVFSVWRVQHIPSNHFVVLHSRRFHFSATNQRWSKFCRHNSCGTELVWCSIMAGIDSSPDLLQRMAPICLEASLKWDNFRIWTLLCRLPTAHTPIFLTLLM